MTGTVVATAHWRALSREGADHCRLSRAGEGWLLVGHARFRDATGFAALDYVIRCDENWRTLSADIAGEHGGVEVQVRILCGAEGWSLDGRPQPGLTKATDLDIPFAPAAKVMPLRRMMASSQGPLAVRAAWLRYPDPALACRDQVYAPTGLPDVVRYRAPQAGIACDLTVDRSGFVTFFPGLWEGEVSHEG